MSNINVNNLTPLLGSGSSVSVSGSLVVKNDVTIGGHLYIGDANTDSVTFSAEVSSSILPDANITYDLGSAAKQWRALHLNSLVVHHVTASGNISASGTGTNGTGSFHHVDVNGNLHTTGTGSFAQGMIASNSSSLTYISMSGALDTSYHVSASRILIHGGSNSTGSLGTAAALEVRATASIGYISASGDMTMSGTASFGGGVDALNASGSFQYVHIQENLSGSASGSFNDLFINDAVEIQGVTVIHGNISSSNSVTASFGYVSSSGDLNVVGSVSASRVSASNGFEADLTSTSSFGHVSMSSVHTLPTQTSSFGHVTMSGDLGVGTTNDPLGHVHIKDGNSNGETPSLNANDLVIEGNGNTGLTIMTNPTSQGAIYFGDDSKNDGRIIYQHGVAPRMSIYTQAHEFRLSGSGASFSGDVSSSGRVSASNGFEADGGTTSNFGNVSMSGALTVPQISASRVSASNGFEADTLSSSSFGYVSTSGTVNALGHLSASGNVYGTAHYVGGGGALIALSGGGNIVKLGGASSGTQLHGTSIDITGSISASSDMTIVGDISSSGRISASNGFQAGTLSTSSFGYLSASGTAYFGGATVVINGVAGDITASGNISASGTVYAQSFESPGDTEIDINDSINVAGGVTASGNISSSGTLQASTLQLATNGINTFSVDVAGGVSSSGALQASSLQLATNGINSLTLHGSGLISASSTIAGTALTLATNGDTKFSVDANGTVSASRGYAGTQLVLESNGVAYTTLAANGDATFAGAVSASGTISASSTLFGSGLTMALEGAVAATIDGETGNIYSAGNISSSATLASRNLDIKTAGITKATIDTAGNIYGAGTISSSVNLLGNGLVVGHNGTTVAAINNVGNITGSLVSASGGVLATSIRPHIGGTVNVTHQGGPAFASDSHTFQVYGGVRAGINVVTQHLFTGQITASGHTSTAGTGSFTGGIFSAGNISSSGTVYAPYYSNYHAVGNDGGGVLTATSSGVPIVVTADCTVTLPAVTLGHSYWIINGMTDGTAITVSPNANDKFIINAAGAAGTNNKDLILTAGTAETGDYVKVGFASGDGWVINERAGTWADES